MLPVPSHAQAGALEDNPLKDHKREHDDEALIHVNNHYRQNKCPHEEPHSPDNSTCFNRATRISHDDAAQHGAWLSIDNLDPIGS